MVFTTISFICGLYRFYPVLPMVKLTELPSFTQFYPTGFTHWVEVPCQPKKHMNQVSTTSHSELHNKHKRLQYICCWDLLVKENPKTKTKIQINNERRFNCNSPTHQYHTRSHYTFSLNTSESFATYYFTKYSLLIQSNITLSLLQQD